ncbi:nucleotidyltransferase [Streptomyces sp. SAS_270]|uniref:nucleotidyltransferase n=1 Tax=Streptomyces sp. SAS_270 TaxID=3412748 RepID=UPI00403CFFE0
MADRQSTDRLLDDFLAAVGDLAPVAVWAHGSLAGGDYQEGRSDLDLIAVVERPMTLAGVRGVVRLHRGLRKAGPLAENVHCSYLTPDAMADVDHSHLTWAHDRLMRRPVTPVTRRELHAFGLVLDGKPPEDLLPPVSDAELREFVVRDQREFWRPSVDKARLWTRDIWVDLGMVTFARASVTLREGRLISKREALDLLLGLGAPVEVVDDIGGRRYGGDWRAGAAAEAREPLPPAGPWLDRRAELTRAFLGPAIDRLVAAYG